MNGEGEKLTKVLERIRDLDQASTPPYRLGRFGTIAQEALEAVSALQPQPKPEGVREAVAALDCARSLMMASGHWTNEAGYQTDAALWIDKASEALTPTPGELS